VVPSFPANQRMQYDILDRGPPLPLPAFCQAATTVTLPNFGQTKKVLDLRFGGFPCPFWFPGCCVDTASLDVEMIRRYVRCQEKREKEIEQRQLKF